MTKLLQNRIAESNFTLPTVAVITFWVWLLGGLFTNRWWPQLACFVATTYLMVELSNSNALLRVRSRMVSSAFLGLSCATCPILDSLQGGIAQLCLVACIIILFHTYQDKHSPGYVFYAFFCLGLCSLAFIQIIWLVPIVWILIATQLQSLGWRSWLASVVGLIAPYWLASIYFIFLSDFTPLFDHFAELSVLPDLSETDELWGVANLQQSVKTLAFAFIAILVLIAIAHAQIRSFEDKVRIRQLYGFFTTLTLVLMVLIIMLPQYYSTLMRMFTVVASPLIAHFFTHTHSKATNILFIVSISLVALLTLSHLLSPYLSTWIPSLNF